MQLHTEWKKPAALFLSFLFVVSSLASTLYAHNCSCATTTVSFSAKKNVCTHCKPSNDCCKEKACFIKISSRYFATQASELSLSKSILPASSFVAVNNLLNLGRINEQNFYRSDILPPFSSVPLFILDRSILI